MNLYAYVGNDPLNATDPTGEYAIIARILIRATVGAYYGGVSGATAAQFSNERSVATTAIGAVSGALAGAVGAQFGLTDTALPAAAGSAAGQIGIQMFNNHVAGEPLASDLHLNSGAVIGAAAGAKFASPLTQFFNSHVGVLVGGRREADGSINKGFGTINRGPGRMLGAIIDGFGTGTGELIGTNLNDILEEAGVPATLRLTDNQGNMDFRFANSCEEGLRSC